GLPNVIDIRNIGLVGGIELQARPGAPAQRAFDVFLDCYNAGVLIRTTGDTIALSPPLIIEREQIDQIVGTIANALKRVAEPHRPDEKINQPRACLAPTS